MPVRMSGARRAEAPRGVRKGRGSARTVCACAVELVRVAVRDIGRHGARRGTCDVGVCQIPSAVESVGM